MLNKSVGSLSRSVKVLNKNVGSLSRNIRVVITSIFLLCKTKNY